MLNGAENSIIIQSLNLTGSWVNSNYSKILLKGCSTLWKFEASEGTLNELQVGIFTDLTSLREIWILEQFQ